MTERIILIGAGSAVFTQGLVADMILAGRPCELALVDVDPEALEVAERLTARMIEARGAPISLRAETDRRQLLRDATAVICTIAVGKRRAWEQDVLIPRRHGIYQPVGDTVMPGGASRALRMIPPMVAIARDALDLAPEALLFNYGNPMAPVCRAVRKATGAGIVGLCHGVADVGRYIARELGVEPARATCAAVGLNHLTWFTEVRVDGQDATARLRELAERHIGGPPEANPFSWWLLKMLGAIPSALDRHAVEFFPQFFRGGRYCAKTLGVDVFSFEDTIARGDRRFEEMRRLAFAPEPLGDEFFARFGGEHEQVIEIIDSIRRDAGRVYSANLPNRGQVPNLPAEAILESPAAAYACGLRAICQPPLPAALAGVVAARCAYVETVVEAALEGSRDKFIQALVLDGSVDSQQMAEQLADDLLAAQAEHLPQFAKS